MKNLIVITIIIFLFSFQFQNKTSAQVVKVSENNIQETYPNGLWNLSRLIYFYTIKSQSSWGTDGFLYKYQVSTSSSEKIKINSDYFLYPISLSPNEDKIVLAERAQSAGEVNLTIVNLNDGNKKVINKVYSPSAVWLNNDSVVLIYPQVKCAVKDFCTIIGGNVKSRNLQDQNETILSTFKNLQFDKLQLSNGKLSVTSRLDKLLGVVKKLDLDVTTFLK